MGFWRSTGRRRRGGEQAGFLRAEPPGHVAAVNGGAGTLRRVRTPAVEQGAAIDGRRARRHLRRDQISRLRLAPALPTVTARHHHGRADISGEVHQRGHTRQLDLRVGFDSEHQLLEMDPHLFVPVDELHLGSGVSDEKVRDVELVATREGGERPIEPRIQIGDDGIDTLSVDVTLDDHDPGPVETRDHLVHRHVRTHPRYLRHLTPPAQGSSSPRRAASPGYPKSFA